MSKHTCPFCGGKVVKEESFCRNCQQIAKRADADSFLKKREEITNKIKESSEPKEEGEENNISIEIVEPKKKLYSVTIVDYLLIAIFLLVAGYTTYYFLNKKNLEQENAYWLECIDNNTSLNYSDYLQRYPKGKFSITAEDKIRELKNLELMEWNDLKTSYDIDSFVAYLEEYPSTPHLSQIKNRIDILAWETALKENTEDSYRAYIENVDLGNYLGGFKDLAQERYNYHSQVQTLEGKERDTVIARIDQIVQTIAKRDTTALKGVLDDNPEVFFKIRGLNKNQLMDSIKQIHLTENAKPKKLHLINAETSIVKDIYNDYFVTTAILEQKGDAGTVDTLRLEMKLNKDMKIMKVVKI